jgi:tetratricopeptide (TPR) repeat protein
VIVGFGLMFLAIFSACSTHPGGLTPTSAPVETRAIYLPGATITSSPAPTSKGTRTSLPTIYLVSTPSTETPEVENQPALRLDRYQDIYYNKIPPALEWMLVGEYSRAIALWDSILADLPSYGYAYYQRARSYYLYALQSSIQAETMNGLKLALKDVNAAIESGPPIGDLFILRYKIYTWFARLEPVRANSIEWLEMALEDARRADVLGNSDPSSDLYPGQALVASGRCQEALDEFAQLLARTSNGAQSGDLNEELARGYLCFGALDEALTHIDLAIQIQPSTSRQMVKAIVLYNMGKLEQAKDLLDEWIENEPSYYPERYFFRALIDFDLGKYDLARSDLEKGQSLSKDLRGVGAYVQGQLALIDGENERGRELMEYAEQSLDFGYGPLLNRIRSELGLARLNISPPVIPTQIAPILTATPVITRSLAITQEIEYRPVLTPTTVLTVTIPAPAYASPMSSWTPAPTPTRPASATPIPTLTRANAPTPQRSPTQPSTVTPLPKFTRVYTPTPYPTLTPLGQIGIFSSSGIEFSLPPHFVFRDLPVPYSGSGPFTLDIQAGGLTLYFYPQDPVDINKIDSFTVTLELENDAASPNLFFQLFRYEGSEILRGGGGIRLDPCYNKYSNFTGFVQRDGGVFVRVINKGGAPLDIENLSLSLSGVLADGSQIDLNLQPP